MHPFRYQLSKLPTFQDTYQLGQLAMKGTKERKRHQETYFRLRQLLWTEHQVSSVATAVFAFTLTFMQWSYEGISAMASLCSLAWPPSHHACIKHEWQSSWITCFMCELVYTSDGDHPAWLRRPAYASSLNAEGIGHTRSLATKHDGYVAGGRLLPALVNAASQINFIQISLLYVGG